MYKIEEKPWGVKLTFSGIIKDEEMNKWFIESETALLRKSGKFGVLIDMRDLKPLAPEVTNIMQKGQKLFKDKGMERSAVILQNPIVTMQFSRIAKESGIYAWERYIDASKVSNFEEVGQKWITDEIDPDKNK